MCLSTAEACSNTAEAGTIFPTPDNSATPECAVKDKNTDNVANSRRSSTLYETSKSKEQSGKEKVKKTFAISAKRGTVKRRKQTKALIAVISQPKQSQEFDPGNSLENANYSFQSNLFNLNVSGDHVTPFTPVSKLPSGFSNGHIETPSWFQTPVATGDFPCPAVTPAYLKEALGDSKFFQTTDVADKCIVQMQKGRKRRKTLAKTKAEAVKKKVVIPNELIHVEVDEAPHSSDDDEYFSS